MAVRDTRKAIAEPIRDGIRSGIDWTARTRGTILDAERYSRFVALMKRALPIAAGVIVMAVVAYSLIPRPSDRGLSFATGRLGRLENDLTMTHPRLTGTDTQGHPYVITADAAIQDVKNIRHVRLKNIEADMTLDHDRWLNANATSGFIDADKEKLRLDGGIAVYSDSGYEIHTSAADVDLKLGSMAGNNPVTGQGPTGAFSADRFRVDHQHQMIYLLGNVHTTIYAEKK